MVEQPPESNNKDVHTAMDRIIAELNRPTPRGQIRSNSSFVTPRKCKITPPGRKVRTTELQHELPAKELVVSGAMPTQKFIQTDSSPQYRLDDGQWEMTATGKAQVWMTKFALGIITELEIMEMQNKYSNITLRMGWQACPAGDHKMMGSRQSYYRKKNDR